MAIELYDAVDEDGLFNILGKFFRACDELATVRQTDVPTAFHDAVKQYKLKTDPTLPMETALDGLAASVESWAAQSESLPVQAAQACARLLVEFVDADAVQPVQTLQNALDVLLDQMQTNGDSLFPSAVAVTPAVDTATGDFEVLATIYRGDGLMQMHALAETLTARVVDDANPLAPVLRITGPRAVGGLAEDYPLGSGTDTTIVAADPATTLVLNGDFEAADAANTPSNWIIRTGTVGTTVKLTSPEVQTVAISGTPTGGFYYLMFTDRDGIKWITDALDYNATSAAVETALRALPGLESVTVAESGTTPNLTHTITFTGVAGDVTALTSVSHLTGGTPVITHGTTTAGNASAWRGVSLEFDSDGSQLTQILQPVTLEYDRVYFFSMRLIRAGAVSSGNMTVDLVAGIDGSVTVDDSGTQNSVSFSAASIGTGSHSTVTRSFRLARQYAQPVYLRIRITSAITNTASIYIDDVVLVEGTELYPGGPIVAAVAGRVPPKNDDSWTIAVTNTRAGLLHDWLDRFFDLRGRDMLFPTNASPTIPDSVMT